MKKLLYTAVFLSCFCAALRCCAQLTGAEQQMVAYINSHMGEALQLLKQTVDINSGSQNVEGVKKVGGVFAEELKKLGFTIEWVSEPPSSHRAGHLVATHTGKKGKRIFLIGHLDTVFEPDMPAGPFTMLNDTIATGQGVNDIKGGDVLVVSACKALAAAGLLQDMNLVVYFTGDEESFGGPHEDARRDFIDRAKTCDIALGFETASTGLHTVVAARRGYSSWALQVTAKTGHSGVVFSDAMGYGAIYEVARVINTFREQLGNEKYLTFNPGSITGGAGKENIVAPTATASGDLRFISDSQRDAAREKMKVIVANSLNKTTSTISFTNGLPAMPPTAGNLQLVSVVDKVTRDMGIGASVPNDPSTRGAGDISDVAPYMDCLDGLGAPGEGAHKAGETINLKQYPLAIQRAAILLYRLTR